MYIDVLRWTIIMGSWRTTGGSLAALPAMRPGRCGLRLLLARRQALTGFHPLDKGGLAVANGTANLDVGRSITPHPCLRQPRTAEPQALGRFLRG
jgi:hypothetical protein